MIYILLISGSVHMPNALQLIRINLSTNPFMTSEGYIFLNFEDIICYNIPTPRNMVAIRTPNMQRLLRKYLSTSTLYKCCNCSYSLSPVLCYCILILNTLPTKSLCTNHRRRSHGCSGCTAPATE